jgi:uncharacterized cupin superfamily protein
VIAHWDDLEPTHEAEGTIEFDGYDLDQAAGTLNVGVTRARVRPGRQSSPVYVEVAEEPRPRVVRAGVSLEVPPIDPWALEAAQGELELPAPSPRRANIVNVDDVEGESGWRNLGRVAGSVRTGIKHVVVPAGQLHCPPHCHAAEEEIFVVIAGDGLLELTPVPDAATTARPPSSTMCAPVTSSHAALAPGWLTPSEPGKVA